MLQRKSSNNDESLTLHRKMVAQATFFTPVICGQAERFRPWLLPLVIDINTEKTMVGFSDLNSLKCSFDRRTEESK
ncbi:MAG: hypothetical protein HWE26_17395 [Alteromonadaceae bacterium]|nr:hypothetical protein [Alteromonadaceae bacterium]